MQVCFFTRSVESRDTAPKLSQNNTVNSISVSAAPGTNVYIRDFDPDVELTGDEFERIIFLVSPSDLPAFARRVQGAQVCMLLKPVDPEMLEQALERIHRKQAEISKQITVDRLRSDRDELLQQLLFANLKLQQSNQARANGGRVMRTIHLEPASIETCIRHATDEVRATLREKRIEFTSQIEPEPRPMLIEPGLVAEILTTLFENACTSSPCCGSIEVRGYSVWWNFRPSARDGSVVEDPAEPHNAYRIDVKDSGKGITPSVLDAVFEQYTASSASGRAANGLGLAICRLYASAHGGHIFATSNGDGATFSLVLPFEPEATGNLLRMSEEGYPVSASRV